MKNIITLVVVFLTTISFAQEVKFGKVSKAELEEKFYPKDSVSEAAYLYRYRRSHYEYSKINGFRLVTEFQIRIKIYNKEGFDKANTFISYYKPDSGEKDRITGVKGYTFNLVDGKIKKDKLSKEHMFDEKMNKFYSRIKITMPNVKEGSVIDIKYRLTSSIDYVIDDLKFQFDIPVRKLLYKVEVPEWYQFTEKQKGFFQITPKVSKPNKRFEEGFEAFVKKSIYEGEDIPAVRDNEPYVNFIDNYRGALTYELTAYTPKYGNPKYFSFSWPDVVKQIYKSEGFGGQLNKVSYFKTDLQNLLSSLENDTQKIVAIFQFVKSKVKWNGYSGKYASPSVRKAYKEGAGNSASINLMLTAMLREAGFNANPVLVSTRDNGIPFSPTSKGFNYVITAVTLANGNILMDATDPYSSVNVLPLRALNWNGRIVRKGGSSSWISLNPIDHASDDKYISIKLSSTGEVTGMVRTKYTNLNALNYRKRNNVLKEEDVIEKLEDIYSIEIENFKITNEKNIFKPLARLYTFSSEDLVEEIGGKLYLNPLLFHAKTTNPFKIEDRKYPVDYGVPTEEKFTVKIQLPEGYKVESIPETLAIGLPDDLGVYKYKVTQTGNKITAISIFKINRGVITQNYYKQLKDFYRQMVEKQTEKIVITK